MTTERAKELGDFITSGMKKACDELGITIHPLKMEKILGEAAAAIAEKVVEHDAALVAETLRLAGMRIHALADRCEYPKHHDECDFFGCFDLRRLADEILADAQAKREAQLRDLVATWRNRVQVQDCGCSECTAIMNCASELEERLAGGSQ